LSCPRNACSWRRYFCTQHNYVHTHTCTTQPVLMIASQLHKTSQLIAKTYQKKYSYSRSADLRSFITKELSNLLYTNWPINQNY